jgi:hypothetical protein
VTNPAGNACNYCSKPGNFAYDCWKKRLNTNSSGNMKHGITDRKDGNVTITDSKRKVFAKTNRCCERSVICNPHDVRRVYMLGSSSRPRPKKVADCYAPCRKTTEGVRTVRAAKIGNNASENAGISQTAVVSKSVGFRNPEMFGSAYSEDRKSHVVANCGQSYTHW